MTGVVISGKVMKSVKECPCSKPARACNGMCCTVGAAHLLMADCLFLADAWAGMQGMTLDDALNEVKTARPQAHPYVDCWKVSPAVCVLCPRLRAICFL